MKETRGEVAQVDFSGMDGETAKLYRLDGRPKFRLAAPVALQHLLAMFASNIAPVIIVTGAGGLALAADDPRRGIMLSAVMFAAGIATLVNCYPIRLGRKVQIGSGLPVIMGTAMTFVAPMLVVVAWAKENTANPVGALIGAVMVAAFAEMIIGLFYRYLKPFFPPLVIGCTLLSLGLSLLPVGVNYLAGGQPALPSGALNPAYATVPNMILGFGVFFLNLFLQRFGTGMWKISSILISLVVGYLVAIPMGLVNFASVSGAAVFSVPVPWQLRPEFHPQAIVMLLTIFLVSGLSTIGYTGAMTSNVLGREARVKETSGAIFNDSLSSVFAACFNALPSTEFGANSGMVILTKICNRWCIALTAFAVILASFFPHLAAVLGAIPESVLGGGVLAVFAMIMTNGVIMVSKSGFSSRNVVMLTVIFGIGLGFAGSGPLHGHLIRNFPGWMQFIFRDRITLISIVAVLTNVLFMRKADWQGLKERFKEE
ncbi:MAG: hypothetical protein FWD94_00335 [Treponema sp.]|nr:hypothetical protein [Treponema sp.]